MPPSSKILVGSVASGGSVLYPPGDIHRDLPRAGPYFCELAPDVHVRGRTTRKPARPARLVQNLRGLSDNLAERDYRAPKKRYAT
jgi:hypothetical protein